MSKKDKRNRGTGRNSQDDYPDPEFDDIIDEFTSSIDAMNAEFEQNVQTYHDRADETLVDDSDDEDDLSDEEFSPMGDLVGNIVGSFGSAAGFLGGKIRLAASATGAFFVFLGQKAVWTLRKAASFFRSGEDESEEEAGESTDIAEIANSKKTVKPVDAAAMLADYDDEEEDAEIFASYRKWIFRSGIAAAVLVAATGGYFGVKTFLGKTNSGETEMAQQQDGDVPTVTIMEEVEGNVSLAGGSGMESPALSEMKSPVETAKKETKKVENTVESNQIVPPPPQTEFARTPKIGDGTTDVAAASPTSHSWDIAPPVLSTPAPPVADPWGVTADPPPAEAKPDTAVSFDDADPWGVKSTGPSITPGNDSVMVSESTVPESTVSNEPPMSPLPPSTIPETIAEAPVVPSSEPPSESPFALPALSAAPAAPPEPSTSAALQAEPSSMAPPELSAFAENRTATPPETPPGTPMPEQPKNAASTTLASFGAPSEPSELPQLQEAPSLRPLAKRSNEKATIGEQAPAIPEPDQRPSSSNAFLPSMNGSSDASGNGLSIPDRSKSGEAVFGQAPAPPVLDTAPPMDNSLLPAFREEPKEETVPAIVHTGNVKPLAGFVEPTVESKPLERVPSIPKGPETGGAATFATPSPVAARARETSMAGDDTKAAYVPPSFNSPGAGGTAPPLALAAIPTSTTVRTPKASEPAPTIPADSSPTMAAFTTPVTPLQPEQKELARAEAPLGSRLQSQVQEIREYQTDADTPKIRFASSDGVQQTGAVKFNPTRNTPMAPLPMPADSNTATGLSALLPSGTAAGSETEMPLPSLDSAPQSVMATAGPGYGRSVRTKDPAKASLDTSARSEDRQRRATSFKQRLDSEITKSPTSTEQYTVQEGDTYWTICHRFFDTGLLFRALAEHNRQKLGVAYMPEPGTVIEIPTADYLKNNYSETLQHGRRRLGSNGIPPSGSRSSSSQPRQGIRYVVQEGDTVFSIATDKLKDTPLWRDILAMNRDKVGDPRNPLPAGTEILLPVGATAQANPVRR